MIVSNENLFSSSILELKTQCQATYDNETGIKVMEHSIFKILNFKVKSFLA